MRSDARKRDHSDTDALAVTQADRTAWHHIAEQRDATLADIRTLAGQLLADADTTHRDPFLRGCATGTTDTAQAILDALGDSHV